MDGESFVHEEFAQRSLASGFPVGVIAPGILHEIAHGAAAGGRGVADDVRDFMCQPERDQFRIETETLRVGIGDAREVFKAHKGHTAAFDDELSCIGGADTDHEDNIVGDIDIEQRANLVFGRAGQRDNIRGGQQRMQITAIGDRGGTYDVFEMGP